LVGAGGQVEVARDLAKRAPKAGVRLDLPAREALLEALANAAVPARPPSQLLIDNIAEP